MLYLSLSFRSSTTLFCPLGTFAGSFPDTRASTLPLLLACLNASSVFAFAGPCGAFSPWSCHLAPWACLTPPAAALAPPVMVVLRRRLAGPLISALSLISAALSHARLFNLLSIAAGSCYGAFLLFHSSLQQERSGLHSSRRSRRFRSRCSCSRVARSVLSAPIPPLAGHIWLIIPNVDSLSGLSAPATT